MEVDDGSAGFFVVVFGEMDEAAKKFLFVVFE